MRVLYYFHCADPMDSNFILVNNNYFMRQNAKKLLGQIENYWDICQ